MYSKDEMILWSMIGSMVTNVGKTYVLTYSPSYLYELFNYSNQLNKNIFQISYAEIIDIINLLKDGLEKEKLKNLFSDYKLLRNLKNSINIEKEYMIEKNIKMITYFCEKYPKDLKKYKIPPFVLFYKGKEINENNLKKSIGIIGTRLPKNSDVLEFTENFIHKHKNELKYNVSGLALGCDTIGHRVTLNHKIKNIAILGQGLGTEVFPKENIELHDEILKNDGTILSEIPPSLKVKSPYLLHRNRLQAYFSNELLILESEIKGGTITTLKVALSEKKKINIRNIESNYKLVNNKQKYCINFI